VKQKLPTTQQTTNPHTPQPEAINSSIADTHDNANIT